MQEKSWLVLERLASVLRGEERIFAPEDVHALADIGLSEREAVAMLLTCRCGFDPERDRDIYERYVLPALSMCNAADDQQNLYLQTIRWPEMTLHDTRMVTLSYRPYEVFVRDDLQKTPDGRLLPQLGYYPTAFSYPALLQRDMLWMSVTPNEVATMAGPLARAHGHVLLYGLGMGYFAFMASEKQDVTALTIVERDRNVLTLFERFLQPQFPQRQKIKLIEDDAFRYAQEVAPLITCDAVFADLWHDVSDGLPMYKKLKAVETPGRTYDYWIEPSMRFYE